MLSNYFLVILIKVKIYRFGKYVQLPVIQTIVNVFFSRRCFDAFHIYSIIIPPVKQTHNKGFAVTRPTSRAPSVHSRRNHYIEYGRSFSAPCRMASGERLHRYRHTKTRSVRAYVRLLFSYIRPSMHTIHSDQYAFRRILAHNLRYSLLWGRVVAGAAAFGRRAVVVICRCPVYIFEQLTTPQVAVPTPKNICEICTRRTEYRIHRCTECRAKAS